MAKSVRFDPILGQIGLKRRRSDEISGRIESPITSQSPLGQPLILKLYTKSYISDLVGPCFFDPLDFQAGLTGPTCSFSRSNENDNQEKHILQKPNIF